MLWIVALISLLLIVSLYLLLPPVISVGSALCESSRGVILFWSGGYDSTARLLQLLVVEKRSVHPVYVMAPNTDCRGFYMGRRNICAEKKTMTDISKMITEMYPYTKDLLLPTTYVIWVTYDNDIKTAMKNLADKGKLSRDVSQYGAFATISRYYNVLIEECAEKGANTGLGRVVEDFVIPDDKSGFRLDHNVESDLQIFSNLRFPIIKMTKEDLLEQARREGYDDILYKTTSCWYPRDGKSCGVCNMCKERIL